MFFKDLLGTQRFTTKLPTALATAGTVDEIVAFRAPFNLTVTAVRYLPAAALTGVTATEVTLAVKNRALDGAGTTEIASLSFIDAEDAVAFDEKTIPLTATVADRDALEGELVTIEKTVTSTGLALDGTVEIEFSSNG